MYRKKHKKTLALALAVSAVTVGFIPTGAQAAAYIPDQGEAVYCGEDSVISVSEEELSEPLAGAYGYSNKDAQNYTYSSSNPVQSYLVPLADGGFMRVQGSSDTSLLVQYYDAKYQLVKEQAIAKELPLWGGFYAGKDGYYVVTGQANNAESDQTEVYRVTKYSKDWKRMGSDSLYGANTTLPFRAGSLRMAEDGKYLLIRTCHQMYTSKDGLRHQANVTMCMDTEKIKITDSFTKVMNSQYGYVSHSFDQYIQVEDGHIVALDLGDAYPRSAVLIRYNTDYSDGVFTDFNWGTYNWDTRTYEDGTFCSVTDALKFEGDTGANYTGASIGGLEISSTHYITCGNSVPRNENYAKYKTRNIWVSSVDKKTGEVTTNWVTSYAEGTASATTPHLVSLGDDSFMLLWGREGMIYYAKLNAAGQVDGFVKSTPGYLSDCKPVVIGNRLVWYVYDTYVNGGAPTFMRLKLNFGDPASLKPSEDPVADFLERMYVVALERASDPNGIKFWEDQLLAHTLDGAGVAEGFMGSTEFVGLGLTDGDYVDTLYATFFNRAGDASGREYWMGLLAQGKSRGYVLSGFVNSKEFDTLCSEYGILRGDMDETGKAVNPGIRLFVERQYTKCLGRDGEKAGIDYWTGEIVGKRMTPLQVAKNFFESKEFLKKDLTEEAYIEILYQTFMDRASDASGVAYWLNQMEEGASRGDVLDGFAASNEFKKILKDFGL